MLPVLAPIVMSALGTLEAKQGLDAGGLAGLVTKEHEAVAGGAPAGGGPRVATVYRARYARPMDKTTWLSVACLVGMSLGAAGCTEKDAAKGSEASGAAAGCGADYADPMKQFCVKVPAGYTPKPLAKPPIASYTEAVDFDAPTSGFQVAVGFSDEDFKTYEDERASAERYMKGVSGRTVDATGKTASEGQWWVYTQGTRFVVAVARSNDGKAITCKHNNTNVTPEVIEACKSIRAYPK